jgi:hypothetical protein
MKEDENKVREVFPGNNFKLLFYQGDDTFIGGGAVPGG